MARKAYVISSPLGRTLSEAFGIVPVEVDAAGAKGLEQVAKYREDKDIKYVATRWDPANPRQQKEPYEELVKKGYVFVAKLFRLRLLGYNIDNGHMWHKSVPENTKSFVNSVLKKLTS